MVGRRWWRQRVWGKLVQEELGKIGRHGEFHTSLTHAQPWVPCKSTGSIAASCCHLLWRAIRMLATEGTAWCSLGAGDILHMIAAQVGGPPKVSQCQLSVWAIYLSTPWDGEVEADGRLCTFTGFSSCYNEAKTQPVRLFSCAKCTSKWHYALQHFGKQMWEEWRSILGETESFVCLLQWRSWDTLILKEAGYSLCFSFHFAWPEHCQLTG